MKLIVAREGLTQLWLGPERDLVDGDGTVLFDDDVAFAAKGEEVTGRAVVSSAVARGVVEFTATVCE